MRDGFLFIDKPASITSHDCVQIARRHLGTRHIGHCGALDKPATGLLVLAVESSTRLSQYIMELAKIYDYEIRFGESTDTGDAEGDVLLTGDASKLEERDVKTALYSFLGVRLQTPPAYSSVKINGERAHVLARRGDNPDIKPRPICIYDINLLDFRKNDLKYVSAIIRVRCSHGTYVRSLAGDLGNVLGVPAHVRWLRRMSIGSIDVNDKGISLNAFLSLNKDEAWSKIVNPIDALSDYESCNAKDDQVCRKIRNGNAVEIDSVIIKRDNRLNWDRGILFFSEDILSFLFPKYEKNKVYLMPKVVIK